MQIFKCIVDATCQPCCKWAACGFNCLFEGMQCLCRLLDGIQCDIKIQGSHWNNFPVLKAGFTFLPSKRHLLARIDGVLAPTDIQGFTHAMFKPGVTLNISGTSAEVAAMPGTLHSRGLLPWALYTLINYNMHRASRHPTDCLDARHLCFQLLNLLLGVYFVSGALKCPYFKASFCCNYANHSTHSWCKLSALLQMRITCDCVAYSVVAQVSNLWIHASDVFVHAEPDNCARHTAYQVV